LKSQRQSLRHPSIISLPITGKHVGGDGREGAQCARVSAHLRTPQGAALLLLKCPFCALPDKLTVFIDVPQQLKRTGWVNHNVHLPESVADHMYRMGMCCMLIDEVNPSVNRSKFVGLIKRMAKGGTRVTDNFRRCVKMAIVHDLAESLVGDITPHDGERPHMHAYIVGVADTEGEWFDWVKQASRMRTSIAWKRYDLHNAIVQTMDSNTCGRPL
jgi:hypothetical protein